MNANELKAERYDHLQAASKLVDAAKNAGVDLAGAALTEYEGHISRIKTIDGQLAKSESLSAHGYGGPQGIPVPVVANSERPSFGIDTDGRAVPIFAKGQSVEQYTRKAHCLMRRA